MIGAPLRRTDHSQQHNKHMGLGSFEKTPYPLSVNFFHILHVNVVADHSDSDTGRPNIPYLYALCKCVSNTCFKYYLSRENI